MLTGFVNTWALLVQMRNAIWRWVLNGVDRPARLLRLVTLGAFTALFEVSRPFLVSNVFIKTVKSISCFLGRGRHFIKSLSGSNFPVSDKTRQRPMEKFKKSASQALRRNGSSFPALRISRGHFFFLSHLARQTKRKKDYSWSRWSLLCSKAAKHAIITFSEM